MAGLPLLVAYKEDEIPVLKVSYFNFFPLKLFELCQVSGGHTLGVVNKRGTFVL